jgi:dihydrofolate reductase
MTMRKIIANAYVSLDGVMEAPEKWTFQYYNEEVQNVISTGFGRTDALLLGRMTYQGFADAFAAQTGGVADIMNNRRKYVVSTTLQTADWINTTLIQGDLAEEITKLKQQPGKDIAISGAAALVQSLQRLDLIDEYSLLVYPVVLGSGKRFFGEKDTATLKLMDAKALSSGIVHLTYQPAGK